MSTVPVLRPGAVVKTFEKFGCKLLGNEEVTSF